MSTGQTTSFYITGGTLPAGSRSYVERRADTDLLDQLSRSEFCYILTSRQMGKSSIMVRTRERLMAQGASVVVLDLTAIGQNLTPEQWHDGLAVRLARQLRLEDEIDDFWRKSERLGPCQRFFSAISEVALPALKARASQKWEAGWDDTSSAGINPISPKASGRLVIFIDELDVVRSLPFRTDEFFAAIRECYTRRLEDPEFNRLSFCLLGVATPSQLIQDVNTTPFNVGKRIELRDFNLREAAGLREGLAGALRETTPEERLKESEHLLERILFWTNGHPYLTQRLCRGLIDPPGSFAGPIPTAKTTTNSRNFSQSTNPHIRRVDALCEELFLIERAREKDDNLLYVRDRLLRSDADKAELLYLYNRIRLGEEVKDDETDPVINTLLLSGIVRIDNGRLVVRNRIYHEVFDDDWIRSSRPERTNESKSIAVLPFVNRSANREDEFLGDGLSEDLISALSRVQGLRVAARTSSFAFKSKNEDVRHIGAKLGVTFLLEGSVRHNGDQLRITAQLLSTADGTPLWSEQFDRAFQDVFAVQDEIVRAIVAGLKVRLVGETDFARRSRTGADAYQSYLRGRYHLHNGSAESFAEAIKHFEASLRFAPDHAPTYAGIAECRLHQFFWNLVPKQEALSEGKAAALKALLLDENLPEAHVSLALMHGIIDWNWDAEERHLQRALELNPSGATAHAYLAMLHAMRRRFEDSVTAARRGVELDPLSPFVHHHLGVALYFAGVLPEAEAAAKRTLELAPHFFRSHALLSNLCQDLGRHEESIDAARKAMELEPNPVSLATLGSALARAGRQTEAKEILDRLESLAQTRDVAPTVFARVHVALNDTEKALLAIESAFQQHSGDLDLLSLWPVFKPLHGEPRFREVIERLKLPLPPASFAPKRTSSPDPLDDSTIGRLPPPPSLDPALHQESTLSTPGPLPTSLPTGLADSAPNSAPTPRTPVSPPIASLPPAPVVHQPAQPVSVRPNSPASPIASPVTNTPPIPKGTILLPVWAVLLFLLLVSGVLGYLIHEVSELKSQLQR